jgi:hypothetical protein
MRLKMAKAFERLKHLKIFVIVSICFMNSLLCNHTTVICRFRTSISVDVGLLKAGERRAVTNSKKVA